MRSYEMANRSELLPRETFGIILVGPSAAGKSSSAAILQRGGIVNVTPTLTTRQRRPVEQTEAPCDHVFISPDEFNKASETGDFIATRSLYGHSYGVPRLRRVGPIRVPLMVLKPSFVEEVLDHYPYLRIYQIEASPTSLLERMRARGQHEADIAGRMRHYIPEIAAGRKLAHFIFNNDRALHDTVQRLADQIHADQASHEPAMSQA